MESQPQNPEFRINPENFHPCTFLISQLNLLKFVIKIISLIHILSSQIHYYLVSVSL